MASAVQTDGARRFPVLTTIATGIAAVAAVAQYAIPAMIPALQRVRAAVLACVIAGLCMTGLRRARVASADRIVLAGCVVSALALVIVEQDLHGASLTAGMLFMGVLLAAARLTRAAGPSSDSHVPLATRFFDQRG